MPNTQTVPTHKIIAFIAFICAALMASLFIYHSSQKHAQPVLSPDTGIVFSVPRDIKSFKLAGPNQQTFTEKNFLQHWTLVFFGFTHCSNVCPTTLEMISRAYPKLHETYPNLQVVLASVDPERDTPESLAKYTATFNPAFIGITGKLPELRKLQGQLGVYSARDETGAADNYQVQHTSSIMLINPKGQWVGLLKFGLKPDVFAQAVEIGIG